MSFKEEKKRLRREMKARRADLGAADKAAADAAVRRALEERAAARGWARRRGARRFVAVYLASPVEIDIDPFIERLLYSGAAVAAPRWNGNEYELARLESLDAGNLRAGPMGIREPTKAATVAPGEVCAWIIPGLAFTMSGKRLGYGGGWYDRLLANAAPDADKTGVAYPFQIVDDIPSESHDILLTDVVSTLAPGFP